MCQFGKPEQRKRKSTPSPWKPVLLAIAFLAVALALLNGRPEVAARIRAAVHLDMVGGGPETKAIFHVTRGPASLPSFVHDVARRDEQSPALLQVEECIGEYLAARVRDHDA